MFDHPILLKKFQQLWFFYRSRFLCADPWDNFYRLQKYIHCGTRAFLKSLCYQQLIFSVTRQLVEERESERGGGGVGWTIVHYVCDSLLHCLYEWLSCCDILPFCLCPCTLEIQMFKKFRIYFWTCISASLSNIATSFQLFFIL